MERHNFQNTGSNVGVFSNHPVIINNDEYSLKKKYLTIHSTDRNITKWPSISEFQINLPQTYDYIYTLKLINIQIPDRLYNFTNILRNTKLSFYYTDIRPSPSTSDLHTITLDDGYYTPSSLAISIQNKMNEKIMEDSGENSSKHGINIFSPIICKYDKSSDKILFGCSEGSIELKFDVEEKYYSNKNTSLHSIYKNNTHWGLGYFLGFEKKSYTQTSINIETNNFYNNMGGVTLYSEESAWIAATNNADGVVNNKVVNILTPTNRLNVSHNNKIYMEIDKYNHINEIEPFSTSTTTRYNNTESFKTNGSFAIIPVRNLDFTQNNESTFGHLNTKALYYPPLQNLRKLKFRFRDHMDNLIDFKEQDISFTLEFGCLMKGGTRNINSASILSEIS